MPHPSLYFSIRVLQKYVWKAVPEASVPASGDICLFFLLLPSSPPKYGDLLSLPPPPFSSIFFFLHFLLLFPLIFIPTLPTPGFIPMILISLQSHNKKLKRNSEMWTHVRNAFLELNANNFFLLLLHYHHHCHITEHLSGANDVHSTSRGSSHLVLWSSCKTGIIWPILLFPRSYNQEVAESKRELRSGRFFSLDS